MENTIVKALICDNQVRLFFVDNTKLINEIFSLNDHNKTNITSKLALGKAISIMSLLSGTLKEEQRLSLQLSFSNPKYKIFADADAKGNVCGYLNHELEKIDIDRTKESLAELVGNKGTIRMIRTAQMHQFTGITDMPYRNITDDISHYFLQSEQIQTSITANIKLATDHFVHCSNAVYAQLLPGASVELMAEVKEIIYSNQAFFTNLKNYCNNSIEEKLNEQFINAKVIGFSPIQFFCVCSKEMFYGIVSSLNKHDLKEVVANQEAIETTCQICGRTYSFAANEIEVLFN